MAIIARWRIPPENWCGYWSAAARRVGMPTSSSSSTDRDRAWPAQVGVGLEDLAHLRADRHHRVERRHRVLEDHRDRRAAELAQAPLADL